MPTTTPIGNMGWQAPPFRLKGTDSHFHGLKQLAGKHGTVVVFIGNRCPYVEAMMPRLLHDARELHELGVHTVAINANDERAYPEEGFGNMKLMAKQWELPFHYLHDDTQEVARAFGAVCTPDIFGLDAGLRLQYRGRLDAHGLELSDDSVPRELFDAMRLIAQMGEGPGDQQAGMGCRIKWREVQEVAEQGRMRGVG